MVASWTRQSFKAFIFHAFAFISLPITSHFWLSLKNSLSESPVISSQPTAFKDYTNLIKQTFLVYLSTISIIPEPGPLTQIIFAQISNFQTSLITYFRSQAMCLTKTRGAIDATIAHWSNDRDRRRSSKQWNQTIPSKLQRKKLCLLRRLSRFSQWIRKIKRKKWWTSTSQTIRTLG